MLLARNRMTAAWRAGFLERGFVEVETAALQTSPGNEAHISAFATQIEAPGGARHPLYLHTSPEFACKKLLAAGETRLFNVARVFRNGERGPLHHPEFTLLEWYRTEADYLELIDDCRFVLAAAVDAAGGRTLRWRGGEADAFAEPERLSVAAAFRRYADIDLLGTLNAPQPEPAGLVAQAQRLGIRVASDDTWSDLFSKILCSHIEPHLGFGRPTVLMEYPVVEAALARPCAHDARLAERFELYACGVELANAFGELTDAVEQRRRFEMQMQQRQAIYGERYPVDEEFLAALAQMPQASGIALGVDRVAMLATGATHIEQVLWTPVVETPTVGTARVGTPRIGTAAP